MSVHAKLMQARLRLQGMALKKSGQNKFAGYSYFELADFLPACQVIFSELGLCGVVSYKPDIATLTITDIEGGGTLEVTSPMSTAALKGCHEVQNLGAVETYTRRYLWVTAMEIVEHDALDATTGQDQPKKGSGVIAPTDGALEGLSADLQISAQDDANYIIERWEANDKVGAFDSYMTLLEGDQQYAVAVWGLLKPHSKIRSELKRMKQAKESGG